MKFRGVFARRTVRTKPVRGPANSHSPVLLIRMERFASVTTRRQMLPAGKWTRYSWNATVAWRDTPRTWSLSLAAPSIPPRCYCAPPMTSTRTVWPTAPTSSDAITWDTQIPFSWRSPNARIPSALDVNCKAHDLDNLYVVDGSFFPSSAAVNPALTIMANALRVGDHLLGRLGSKVGAYDRQFVEA
jgi:hypothetical protein